MCYENKQVNSLRTIAQRYSAFVRDAQDSNSIQLQSFKTQDEKEQTLESLLNLRKEENHKNPDFLRDQPRYFKKVFISNLSCTKIFQHSVEGGDIEIMGMLVGTVYEDIIIVYDCFLLPVEGTETRVNAQLESYEYMVQYMSEIVDKNAKSWNIVGWYHSHPGYGCWLSGTDVQTQELNQQFQDPYVAIVVDPKKSLQDQKLNIGAFRTLPRATDDDVPMEGQNTQKRVDDEKYGCHSSRYYELEVRMFCSKYDNALDHMCLRQTVPRITSEEEPVLFEQFFESIRNWNNFQKMTGTNDYLSQLSSYARQELDEEVDSGLEIAKDSLESHRTSRANSLASGITMENGSDVDMDNTDIAENGSGGSSISTAMLDRPSLISEHELQEDLLRKEYYVLKKKLELLKLEEFERIKFYKDAFSL